MTGTAADQDAGFRQCRALRERGGEIAASATRAFLDRHPEWCARFGERARTRGEEDGRFHVGYLAAALEMGTPQLFVDYLRWTAGVLSSRDIDSASLYEFMGDLLDACDRLLDRETAVAARGIAEPALSQARQAGPQAVEQPAGALAPTMRLFTEAALRGDRRGAWKLVEATLGAGVRLRDIYVQVLQEAQYEVGRRWQANRISVTREHMATAVTQAVVTLLYERLPRVAPERGTMIVTGVEGEQHQLGARMVADFLEADGWDVRFLGTQMPHEGILDAIEDEGAQLVGISAALSARLPTVRDLISAIGRRFGEARPRILVGGSAFRGHDIPWRHLGADGLGMNLDDAVRTARALASPLPRP